MKGVRISMASALLAACGLLLMPAPARAQVPPEFANWFAQLPSFSTDTFTVILRGDQTAVIPSQNAFDKLTNPFAYNLTMTPQVTVSLDGMDNTDVVCKGSAIAPGTTFPDPNLLPHFGLENGVQPPNGFQVLSETWSSSIVPSNMLQVESMSITTNPTNLTGPTFNFLTVFAQAGGVGEWFEVPFQPGTLPKIQISNNSNTPFTLSNAGYFLSSTEIPLDNLNYDTLPPPGQPGSMFAPLPGFDGMTLAPGTSISVAIVPEPGSMLLIGQGCLGIVGARDSRRARNRRLISMG